MGHRTDQQPDATRPQVVVVGAGFGGLAVTKELVDDEVDVVLVDRNNFHTFQPLLYQVATSGLNAADVAHPVRDVFQGHRNVHVRRATVQGVDWDGRRVLVDRGGPLAFDHLVLAAGASASFFGIPGAQEHAHPLYNLTDAVRLRNHVLERFEAADADPSLIEDGALTFVVVGGGPTGVEVAGALAELFDHVLRHDFHGLEVERAHVVLVEMAPSLLGTFSERSQRHARRTLQARGVEVRTGARVASVDPTRVTFEDGSTLPAHTLVWAAGVRANPLAEALGVETGRGGRVVVGDDLQVPGHPGVWAIGDVAAIEAPGGGLLPQLAPVAMQSGRHVARQIRRSLAGERTEAFHYTDKGTMATIGRRSAVAELPGGIRLSGTPAWLAWLLLHLVFLVGFRNRVSVLLNWAWNYLTWDRGPRLILDSVGDAPADVPGADDAAA